MSKERLQKVLAQAGLGSRRACEQAIRDGRVQVNRETVSDLPVLVDIEQDRIHFDGRIVRFEPKVYYMLNKPEGVLCTALDPDGRKRAIDLMQGVKQRLFPVGRLDADSQGLLLMTNDGELAEKLTHPRYGVAKTYAVVVEGRITGDEVKALCDGVWLSEGRAAASRVKIVRKGPRTSLIEVVLREGRNRQVRRMLARIGHKVRRLTRVRMGPLVLKGVGAGKYRPLTAREIATLRRSIRTESEPTQDNTGAGKASAKKSSRPRSASPPHRKRPAATNAPRKRTATRRPKRG